MFKNLSKTTWLAAAAGLLTAVQPYITKNEVDFYQAFIGAAIFLTGFFTKDTERRKGNS